MEGQGPSGARFRQSGAQRLANLPRKVLSWHLEVATAPCSSRYGGRCREGPWACEACYRAPWIRSPPCPAIMAPPCGRVEAVGCLTTPTEHHWLNTRDTRIRTGQILTISEFCISTGQLRARCGKKGNGKML